MWGGWLVHILLDLQMFILSNHLQSFQITYLLLG